MSCNRSWKCYFGCEVDGVLHRFPNPRQNAERFHLWTRVLDSDIQNRDPMYIYNTLRLCDKHFELCYRTPNGKLTRNAFPIMNTAAYQSGSQPLLMDEAVLRESSNIDLTSTSAAYQSGSQPLLMDEAVLGESSNIDLTSVSVTQEITQPTKLQSDLLINLISGQNPSTSQPLDANVTLHVQNNVENPSTSKDILQSADTSVVTKRQLLRNTYQLESKLKRLSAKCKTQKQQFKSASNLAKSKVFLKYIESLPEPVQIFTEMQMKIKKKPRGRRYTTDEKILALSILKQSPKAYNMLKKMFVLPSKRCLQQQLRLIRLEPGVNAQVFTHLKRAVKRLPKEKRLCTLIVGDAA